MVNKVTLIGNLGKDPEVRRLENGVAVAKFSVATNENYKDRNSGEWITQTEWHDVVAWRLLAERAEQQLKKGKLVYIEGKLTHRKWQDDKGNNRYTTEVVANTLRLLEKREGGGTFNSSFPSAENAPPPAAHETNKSAPVATSTASTTSAETAKSDDLPF